MSILKAVNSRAKSKCALKGLYDYIVKESKTEKKLIYGYCVDAENPVKEMNRTKIRFGKNDGKQYFHFVHSFPPSENITLEQVHEAGMNLIETYPKFQGFEVFMGTHKDRKHLHNHIVVNSVSFIDGKKFHMSKQDLKDLKEFQDKLSISLGYSAAPKKGFDLFGNKKKSVTANNAKTYRAISKSEGKESYLVKCKDAILKTLKMSIATKEQFIKYMEIQGFKTKWSESKKHITFVDIEREKAGEKTCNVRLKRLAQYFPEIMEFQSKEELENAIGRSNGRYDITTTAGSKHSNRPVKRIDDTADGEQQKSANENELAKRRADEVARINREFGEIQRRKREEDEINYERNESESKHLQQHSEKNTSGNKTNNPEQVGRNSGPVKPVRKAGRGR